MPYDKAEEEGEHTDKKGEGPRNRAPTSGGTMDPKTKKQGK